LDNKTLGCSGEVTTYFPNSGSTKIGAILFEVSEYFTCEGLKAADLLGVLHFSGVFME